MTHVLTVRPPVHDVEIEVEACATCDRPMCVTTRCACCERPVCRDCGRVNSGVVWCEDCIDDSWDMLPGEWSA